MIVPALVDRKYALVHPYVARAAEHVRDLVRGFCEEKGYAFIGRIKGADSLAEKIETGRFARWSDLDDLYACSVIVPTLAEEPETLSFLTERFRVIEIRGRGTTLQNPEVFRFDATRFIGQLRTDAIPAASDELRSIRFEVQVRTAFEHAWSVTTRAFAYKADRVDWRRVRLAAQLKASVEQMDNLVAGFEGMVATISEQNWPEISAKKKIEEFFREQFESRALPAEVEPSSWARFCDNLHSAVVATTTRRVRDAGGMISEALAFVKLEVEETSEVPFPRSLSLMQFCLGVLAKRGMAREPLTRYIPLVSSELRDLYPAASALGSGFDFELPD